MGPFCRGARHARGLLLASAAFGLALAASPAAAEGAHAVRIPAGPLDASLLALAAQTHEQVLYSPALVAGRKAPAVSGTLTAEQALAKLLDHADIEVTRPGPGVLVLKPHGKPAVAPVARPSEAQRGPFVPPGDAAGASPGAADGSGPGKPPAPNTVQAVEVTGTHIRGADAGASPLAIVDRADLDRSGQMTVADALKTLPQNFNGQNTDIGTITGTDNRGVNSSYGTGVNLRGLGSSATLVLVNGRRIGGAGTKGDFTDISTLPSIAVDRVEILLDGASAIYGSDAVGGVVNVRMRQDLDGGELRLDGGIGAGGSPKEGQVGLIVGHTWRRGGVTLAYEGYHRTALLATDRDFAASADLRPFGGTDFRAPFSHPGNIFGVDPATGQPQHWAIPAGQDGRNLTAASFQAGTLNLANPHEGMSLLPDQQRQSAYLAAHQFLGDRVELTGDVLYGERRARVEMTAPTSVFTVSRANPFYVSPVGAASETIQYKFSGELPPPLSHSSAETLAVSAGARVDLLGDWRSDAFVDVSQETERTHVTGGINSVILAEALGNSPDRPATPYNAARDGFFNPFTGVLANPPAVLAAIGSGYAMSHRVGRVYTGGLQADGSLLQLPGGVLKLAVGGQWRREVFRQSGVNFTSSDIPKPQQSVDVSRTVGALFAELRAPFFGPDNRRPGLERLEISAAGRWEHYNDFGETATPKVGVLWSPLPDLDLRTTYGRSFRAPGLRELGDPQVNSPVLVGPTANRVLSLVMFGGNAQLQPETARTWTAGVDWRPAAVPGLQLSATWFDVSYRDRIDQPVLNVLSTALSDPSVASFVRRIDPTNPADLALITALVNSPQTSTAQGSFPPASYGAIIDGRQVNTGSLEVEGVDLMAAYGFDLGGGRLDLSANASDLLRYDQTLTPTGATLKRVAVAGFPARLRARINADWRRGAWSLGGSINQLSASHDLAGVHIDDLTTVDLRLRWSPPADSRWRGLTLGLNARNLFDTAPPFFNSVLGFGFDAANADPIGRFVSLQLTRSW